MDRLQWEARIRAMIEQRLEEDLAPKYLDDNFEKAMASVGGEMTFPLDGLNMRRFGTMPGVDAHSLQVIWSAVHSSVQRVLMQGHWGKEAVNALGRERLRLRVSFDGVRLLLDATAPRR